MEPLASVTLQTGNVLSFYPDDFIDQPYAEDDAVKIVVLHRRYTNPAAGEIDSPDEAFAFERENLPGRTPGGTEWAIFPLWLYDHSVIVYRVSDDPKVNPFIGFAQHAEWDSGRVGFIALKRSEWGPSAPRTSRRKLRGYAEGIAADYTAWANGDGVRWALIRDGEEIASVGGFYSLDDAKAAAKSDLGIEGEI